MNSLIEQDEDDEINENQMDQRQTPLCSAQMQNGA